MSESPTPPPGSDEAASLGCICARMDNNYGRGYMGIPDVFVMTENCPLHGKQDDDEKQ